MSEREQFQTGDTREAAFLDAVDHKLERRPQSRGQRIATKPTDYLHTLGPVPTDPEHKAAWLRRATILDRHYLGLDRDPAQRDRSSVLGGPREEAEMMARLEVMAIPREREPIGRTLEPGLGLGLGLRSTKSQPRSDGS